MKHFSKVGLALAILFVTVSLAACGDNTATSAPSPTTALAATPTVTSTATTATPATTAAATTTSATTASTTAPVTPVPSTTAATTPPEATRSDVTTLAATTPPATASNTPAPATTVTTAAPVTQKPALDLIRKTDWLTVLKNDPQLKQETPPEPFFKLFVSVKADQALGGAPDLDNIVYVDVDRDGLEEAAIPLISGGTAGNIGFLLYRQAQPAPRLVGWQEGYKQGLKAVDGKLETTDALYAGWEPNCCPSGYQTLTYGLMGDKLIVVDSRTDGYPEAMPQTVDQFYALLNEKKYAEAYKFLSPNFQKANPYNTWVAGYATSQKVTSQTVLDAAAPETVRVNLETVDSGQVVKHYSGTWKLVWSPDRKGWLLDAAKIQEVAGTPGSTAKVLPLFQSLLDPLKQQTALQVLLPTALEGADPAKLFASIQEVDTSRFTLAIGFTPDCNGANACDYGSISGEVVGLDANQPPLAGTKVALANGETGYYQDAPCGASCGEATISWEQGGVRYTFGTKAATRDGLLKMVNSAITNGPA